MAPAMAQAASQPLPKPLSTNSTHVGPSSPRDKGVKLAPWAQPLPTHRGHEGVRNIPDSVGHHGSETKCPGLQAARPLSVPHFRSLRLQNFVNNLCVAYGGEKGRVPLKTRSLSLPASRKGRQWERGQRLAGERSATSPQPLTLRRCPRHHRIFSRTSPPPTSRIPFLNEVWGRYEAVSPRPAPPQRVDPG